MIDNVWQSENPTVSPPTPAVVFGDSGDGAPAVVPSGAGDRASPLPKGSASADSQEIPATPATRDGGNRFTNPFRRRSVGKDTHHEQKDPPPKPESSDPSTDETKVRLYPNVNIHPVLTCFKAPPPSCSLEVLYPPQTSQDPPATVDVVIVDHFGKDNESTWIWADPKIPPTKESLARKWLSNVTLNQPWLQKVKSKVSRGTGAAEGAGGPEGIGGAEGTGGSEGTGGHEGTDDPKGTDGPKGTGDPEDTKDPEEQRDPEGARNPKDTRDPEDTRNPEDPRDPEDTGGPEGPKDPEGARDPEDPKDLEGARDPEDTRGLEYPKDHEGTRDPGDPRNSEGPGDPEDPRDMKDAKGRKAPQDLGDPKEQKDPESSRDSEDARNVKGAKSGKEPQDLGDPKEPKDSGSPRDPEDARNAEDAKGGKEPKDSGGPRDPEDARNAEDAKGGKEPKDSGAPRDPEDARNVEDSKGGKEPQDLGGPKEQKDERKKVAPGSQDKNLAQRIFGKRGQKQNPQTDQAATKGVRRQKTVTFGQLTEDPSLPRKEQAQPKSNVEQNSGDQSGVQPAKGMSEKDGANKSPATRSPKETLSIDWLDTKNMLRKPFPGARILKFEYPTTSGPDGPKVTLDQAAEKLRSRLLILRNDGQNAPIVFIGRGVGVVVIEQALIQISQLPKEEEITRQILESTAGIIFLAASSDSRDYFAGRDAWFPPKGTASTISPTAHSREFKHAVERKNIFLARLQWSNKSSNSDDTNYSQVSGLIRRFKNSHQFLTAAFERDIGAVEALLDQGVNSNVQNGSGQSALHIAVQNDDFPMARLLLGKGSADIALQDNKGQSALHFAVQRALHVTVQKDELPEDKFRVIELLLAKGADAKAPNKDGHSATNLADSSQNKEIKSRLEKPLLVEGPSASTRPEWKKPEPPADRNAVSACKNFRATLTEFFLINGREHRIIDKQASVYEVLYEQDPESILKHDRPSTLKEKRTCQWFHLPANNVSDMPLPKLKRDLTNIEQTAWINVCLAIVTQ